ncbi:MAG: 2-amino-4-hydroxy-6-hydroxymethyldihydropteridine diphosphokinase [Vicingaceae bacterium]|jgi:2-amino-4-hydroxy-6-hydroxymethyldihydropteridine diphosphokinase|nr:2-amino-4-hydroxy-6-hydroxymethyldihydropteridine diphosphokinase [Flavobacteriales bacterium]MDF1676055.1 2-amino-4-hydroxy-6-hydroxymethyldihydropteridine diphosphokinase [Vicingaceae bacterium]
MMSGKKNNSNQLILSLGGNQGDIKKTFLSARNMITQEVGSIIKESSIYQTQAWGVENQADFLNQVIIVETKLSPETILEKCLAIEMELGRKRMKRWRERTIDIDLLFFNSEIIQTENLQIPHPRISERNFILHPLTEIIPDFIHPILNKSIKYLKNECSDDLKVFKY